MDVPEKSSLDPDEMELPDTVYASQIDNEVFRKIVVACLSHIEGVSLPKTEKAQSFLNKLFSSGSEGKYQSITTEQDDKTHSVTIRIDVEIAYGESIPEKAEEIQHKVSQEVTSITGLHVAAVKVIFKNVAQS